MDDEFENHHELLQSQDNFDPAAREDEAGGPAEDAVTSADAAQDAAPASGAVGAEAPAAVPAMNAAAENAAMNTTEAAMDTVGAEATAADATMDAARESAAAGDTTEEDAAAIRGRAGCKGVQIWLQGWQCWCRHQTNCQQGT